MAYLIVVKNLKEPCKAYNGETLTTKGVFNLRLSRLLEVLSIPIHESSGCDIQHIVFHSKQVQKGDLFVAVPGLRTDGHAYIDDAIMAGACAVIGEQARTTWSVPYFTVPNARLALAKLAAELYGHPYRKHTMIGITGTNGKPQRRI